MAVSPGLSGCVLLTVTSRAPSTSLIALAGARQVFETLGDAEAYHEICTEASTAQVADVWHQPQHAAIEPAGTELVA